MRCRNFSFIWTFIVVRKWEEGSKIMCFWGGGGGREEIMREKNRFKLERGGVLVGIEGRESIRVESGWGVELDGSL